MQSKKNVEDDDFHIHFMKRVMFSDRLVKQRRRQAMRRDMLVLTALAIGLFACLIALD